MALPLRSRGMMSGRHSQFMVAESLDELAIDVIPRCPCNQATHQASIYPAFQVLLDLSLSALPPPLVDR